MPEDMLSQEVEAYDASQSNEQTVGGNKKGKSKKCGPKKVRSKKRGLKKGGTKKQTKKRRNKKGPSKWIMHVKAFCKKTGKTFPEALKDPMCKKSFKN